MASTKDLFYSNKLKEESLIGENNFFKSNNELTQYQKKQERFLTNVDYTQPLEFIKFGSAEEYYKNAISYINTNYPFDKSKGEKLEWINNLNDLEYYIITKEYPKFAGNVRLSASQQLNIYSPNQDYTSNAKNTYNNGLKYFTSASLNLNTGFTFESWLRFPTASVNTNIFKINTVASSSASGLSSSAFALIKTNGSNFVISGATETTLSYTIPDNEWHHYCFNFNSSSIVLFVDGNLTQSVNNYTISNTTRSLSFSKIGLMSSSNLTAWSLTGSYTVAPVFQAGGSGLLFLDETRFWNEPRTVENIGRNWFSVIDGNDFTDPNNNNLIFYYKFNEGWDNNLDICLDSSGRANDASIINYSLASCKFSGSAINSSSLVDDLESGDLIQETSLTNTGILKTYYDAKVLSGSLYDETNRHALYKKFPSWILEEEQELEPKHLKQLIQIISSYFDDLYIKIKEIPKYKQIQNTTDDNKVYPFYDKVLASTGFDFTDIFTNIDAIERISSRNENNIFDQEIEKTKNLILQNIYNNLTYILKSKGTKKSLKAFLRSYGLNENLIKINLYSDNGAFDITDRTYQTTVRKKTVSLMEDQSIFCTSSYFITEQTGNFSLETTVIFPPSLEPSSTNYTSSIFGFDLSTADRTSLYSLNTYLNLINDGSGSKFCFYTGSVTGSIDLVGSSSYYQNLYDNSTWTFAIRGKKNAATEYGYVDTNGYILEVTGVCYSPGDTRSFKVSSVYGSSRRLELENSPYISFYVGARNTSYSGSNEIPTGIKVLNCNFWNDYLSDEEIITHNKDITNYGFSR